METLYSAERLVDTENGWIVTHNETGKRNTVFCSLSANTALDAINTLKTAIANAEAEVEPTIS